jgi:formylglycine-generating enzyme required for sulfatase activity
LLQALAEERPSPYQELLASLPQKESTPKPHETNSFIHEKTGLELVRIPAGEFLFGEKNFRIYLPEFWISKTPVTFAAYQRFIRVVPNHPVPFLEEDWAEPYNWDARWRSYPADKADHPVVLVSWHDASVFCRWLGLQLPTEEQWEKAARGIDGRIYPWGNSEPTDNLCNFKKYVGGTTPVGRYSPQGDSPYGCMDMSGNVWEWCLNKYSNPEDKIVGSDDLRVGRGGSWYSHQPYAHAASRGDYHPDDRYFNLGFRVVGHLPPNFQ